MNYLPENHPEVQELVRKMYEQREQVGKISSFVGYANVRPSRHNARKDVWHCLVSGSVRVARGSIARIFPRLEN